MVVSDIKQCLNELEEEMVTVSAKLSVARIKFKGTVCRYRSRAIMHYFTGSEIIMESKVCMVSRYLSKYGV